MTRKPWHLLASLTLAGLCAAAFYFILTAMPLAAWTEEEKAVLGSLHLAALPPPPPVPANAVADDPEAADFGELLFHDQRLSRDGSVACASCHQPARGYSDGLVTARALGRSARNTPALVGAAWSPWQYWDGRKDSLWSQALAPLEDPAEHGGHRLQYAALIAAERDWRERYEALFGALPDKLSALAPLADRSADTAWESIWRKQDPETQSAVNHLFANLGKVLAAWQRTLRPQPTRFDAYIDAVLSGNSSRAAALFTEEEQRGLRLFIGAARCLECHNGPLLSNFEFHNTGLLNARGELPDKGRSEGLRRLRKDPFNCLGPYSDDPTGHCPELEFVRDGPELIGAMKTPSLRNVAATAPYGHKGQQESLDEVLAHYNAAPEAIIGHNEAKPLGLSSRQLRQLEAFLHTLTPLDSGKGRALDRRH